MFAWGVDTTKRPVGVMGFASQLDSGKRRTKIRTDNGQRQKLNEMMPW